MIIDVQLEGEEVARRYRVQRDNGAFRLRRLSSPDHPVEDTEVHVDFRTPEPRVYSLLVDDASYDVHVDEEADEEELSLHLFGRVLRARASDARRRRVVKEVAGPEGLVRITAPMPGRVVKVLAPEGTEVKRGDGIIVLEAMKMENELKAPRDGVVTQVMVQEGQGVEGGSLLATIE